MKRPNPKKDKSARRKAKPGWHPIKAAFRQVLVSIKRKGSDKVDIKKEYRKI